LEVQFQNIKSLIPKRFRQRVRMAQIWQHFTNELILHLHDPSSSIYSKSGLKMKRELEGNSNIGTWEGGSYIQHVLGVLEPYAPLRLNVGWT